ncbi:MAG TPA: phosphatase PAP2 family protein [Polyangia bacterium]|nr:phosphatase PAP2 family protein [Polyangia bacterium]
MPTTTTFFTRRPVVGLSLIALLLLLLPSVAARADEFGVPRLKDNEHFTIDPVVDGVVTVGGISFAELLSLILSTGEIRPGTPGDPNKLLAIDRVAVTQTVDPNASRRSDYALAGAYVYAFLDPLLSGVRDGRRALLVDGIMYAESIAITQSFTSATKIGVRRPRPIDYARCSPEAAPGNDCTSTDLELSFFSGHASTAGAIAGTASYLAFARNGARSPRPWITLGVGTALTAFISYERVRAGEHFPTDVIMGSLAGAAIGVLVPHLHRRPHYHDKELEAPPMWIGFAPLPGDGGAVTLGARF